MAGFLETLMHPDHEDDPDRAEVVKAANILQIGEFQVMLLAYRDWFGEDLPEQATDEYFRRLMLKGETPHWASRYARRIIDWDKRGLLDDSNPDYHRYDNDYYAFMPQGARRFTIALACLVIAVGGGLLVGHLAAHDGSSVLPPFFEKDDIPGIRGGGAKEGGS